MKEPVISIRGLTKNYGDVVGIKDLDLDVQAGEIMGFLGPNGSGKTTTIRTCLDLIMKTAGEVRIFGLDSHEDSVDIRRRTGYLPGDFGMFPALTVESILRYLLALNGQDDDGTMLSLAERFDLDMDKKFGTLSRGNRQKVGIVQAFMTDQDLVIMDEPTSGLDPLMQQRFYEFLREEKARGKTIFMSSHIMAEVERVCDRVAIIREGRLELVESIDVLKEKMGKRLEIEFGDTVDASVFDIEGVEVSETDGRNMALVIIKNLDEVVKLVAEHNVVNMSLETFSLDQFFMTYYSRRGA